MNVARTSFACLPDSPLRGLPTLRRRFASRLSFISSVTSETGTSCRPSEETSNRLAITHNAVHQ